MSIGCLNKKCGRVSSTRGLCPVCYEKLAKKVRSGETTWEKLVKEGQALAADKAVHWGYKGSR